MKGGDYDYCGVCAGDNSTCTCVRYKGYELAEMEFILLEWTLNHTRFSLDCLIDLFDHLEKQQQFPVDFDFASLIEYLCAYLREELEPFGDVLDEFIKNIQASFGPKPGLSQFNYTEEPWPITNKLPAYTESSLAACDPIETI